MGCRLSMLWSGLCHPVANLSFFRRRRIAYGISRLTPLLCTCSPSTSKYQMSPLGLQRKQTSSNRRSTLPQGRFPPPCWHPPSRWASAYVCVRSLLMTVQPVAWRPRWNPPQQHHHYPQLHRHKILGAKIATAKTASLCEPLSPEGPLIRYRLGNWVVGYLWIYRVSSCTFVGYNDPACCATGYGRFWKYLGISRALWLRDNWW